MCIRDSVSPGQGHATNVCLCSCRLRRGREPRRPAWPHERTQQQMRRIAILMALASGVTLAPGAAHAFCGFYVNGAGGEMFNDATQVTLMRMGTRTVLSMQNNYQGPAEAFATVSYTHLTLPTSDLV